MKIDFILSENVLIRLSISGGMSLRGGFHVDLVYSLDFRLLKSSLVVPAKMLIDGCHVVAVLGY